MKTQPGMFWGIGVGPGPAGYLPLAAMQALQKADLIYVPRAKSADTSVALQCLEGVAVAPERLREVEFNMDPDRNVLRDDVAVRRALAQVVEDLLALRPRERAMRAFESHRIALGTQHLAIELRDARATGDEQQ